MNIMTTGIRTIISAVLLICASANAQTVYSVSVNTADLEGQKGALAFDVTCSTPKLNTFDIVDFRTDGMLGLTETYGGKVSGDLITRANPAALTTIEPEHFFNELLVNFEKFGKSVSFTLRLTNNVPQSAAMPDQLAFYVLDEHGMPVTSEPSALGARADFAITANGENGGELELINGTVRRGANLIVSYDSSIRPAPLRSRSASSRRSSGSVNTASLSASGGVPVELTGYINEICMRRCAGEPSCTGGDFGIYTDGEEFVRFDDNGSAQAKQAVAGRAASGEERRARVKGERVGSVIFVESIEML